MFNILNLVSLLPWKVLMPNIPDESEIPFPGMILIDERISDDIVEQIPDKYFSRPEILAKFTQKRPF